MDFVVVEPVDGTELERLITALLNATGAVHQILESTEYPPDADGEQVIGVVAERIRRVIACVGEHHDDEELALVTGVVAQIALLVGGDLGLPGPLGRWASGSPRRPSAPQRSRYFRGTRPYRSTDSRSSSLLRVGVYGKWYSSRLPAKRVTAIDCTWQYFWIPPGPWRTPRPDSLAPPNGISVAA